MSRFESAYRFLRSSTFCLVVTILTSCGGGGDSDNTPVATTTPNTSIPTPGSGTSGQPSNVTPVVQPSESKATLMEGVRILTDAENALIAIESDTQIRFNGQIDFLPKTVVIGQTTAFKVVTVRTQDQTTVIDIAPPSLEELFRTLQIKATATGAAEQVLGLTKPGAEVLEALTGTTGGTTSFVLVGQSSTINQTLSNKIGVTIDYDYDQAKGGLQSAIFQLESELSTTVTAKYLATVAEKGEQLIAQFRVPIPVSIVDRLLNFVGVRVVSIYIPVRAGFTTSSKLEVSMTRSMTANGTTTIRYDQNGATLASDYTARTTDNPAPTIPSGATEPAQFDNNTSFYFNLRPAVAFLDKVALLGVNTNISADGAGIFQVVKAAPGYCATINVGANLSANGFFKSVTFSEIKTPQVSRNLYTADTFYLGICNAPTLTTLTSTTPSIGKVGRLMAYTVRVEQDTQKVSVIPSTGPTGAVKISVGARECEARLTTVDLVSATGSCLMTPTVAGDAVPVSLSYSVDLKYAVSMGTGTIKIEKSETNNVMTSSPSPSSVGAIFALSAVVVTTPATPEDPTGNIEFRTIDGVALCTAPITTGGRGECSATVAGIGPKAMVAQYMGDANYLASTSPPYTHVISELPTINGAVLTILDTNPGYTGLPATMALSNLYATTPTVFRASGNNCAERGIPLYSSVVPASVAFYGARTVTNIPTRIGGPFINRNNCSSFVAVQEVKDPQNQTSAARQRVIINATGRAAQFSGVALDWEFQVRYDSGDPFTGANKQCQVGPVGNAGFFGSDFTASACSHMLN